MLNPNSHHLRQMVRIHETELHHQADQRRLVRLTQRSRRAGWMVLRARVGQWLITLGERMQPPAQEAESWQPQPTSTPSTV
jgi:hypothetical protein